VNIVSERTEQELVEDFVKQVGEKAAALVERTVSEVFARMFEWGVRDCTSAEEVIEQGEHVKELLKDIFE
jgi:hypothetical protein